MFKKNKLPTEGEILREEYDDALTALELAKQNFENAEPEFFEIANQEMTLARERVNLIAMKMKKCSDIPSFRIFSGEYVPC